MYPTILLFGIPRSGTTWIGKIFDSHPDTLYRHEPDTRIKLNGIPFFASVSESEQYCSHIQNYVSTFGRMDLPQVTAKLPLFHKNYSSLIKSTAFRSSVYLSHLAGRLFRHVVLPTANPISVSRASNIKVVWKSIESLGNLGVIVKCLADVKAVHIVRHPCGYISSVLDGESKLKFVSDTKKSEDYQLFDMLLQSAQARRYDLTIEKLKQLQPIGRLAWCWVLFNEKAMDDVQNLNYCMIQRYEDLCANPLQEAKKMLEFTGLGWSGQTEQFLKNSVTQERDAYYSVYKDPLRSANKWRDKLTKDDIAYIRDIVVTTKAGALYENMF